MDYNEELCWFDKMSDDILLHIFIFVPRTCWKDLSHVCTRFKNVCLDKEIFRVSDLNSAYGWSNNDLKDYLKAGHRYIETLNLSHCYWFSSLVLTTYISKCKNTRSLSLLDCKLTQQGLSKILLSLVNLESLIISVSNLLDFSNAINENQEIQESLKNLKHFGLHNREEIVSYSANTMGFHVSQQVAIFQHCPNIESFSVIGTPCIGQKFAKRLVHPLITKNNNLCNLKVMSINDTENATSRLYFFSVLVRACKLPGIQFSNLSVAGLDFKKAATTHSYFVKSLQGSLPTLKRLDLSKSEIDEFETSMLVPESLNLTHLNLAHVRSEKRCIGLLNIASKCKNLVSLNLKGATSGCRVWGQDELNGLSCVLDRCNNLQHLNLACIHIHEDDTTCSLVDVLTKHNISEFRSLALSVCCLVTKTTLRPQTSNGYISKGPSKRQRISRVQEAGTSSINDSKGSNSLSELSKSCPKLTSLEIIDADCHQSCIIPVALKNSCEQSHKFNDSDLRDLSNWKELNYLQLTCLPGVKSLPCLKVKGESLSTLRVLHLTNIGLGALTPGFWSLLQYFTQLKDLRIEQPLMKLDERFYTPCLQCIQLERLVLISKHCKIQSKPLESFVEKASKLYVIYLITDTTLKECDRLKALLQKRYENRRPGFQVLLEQIDHERLAVKLSSLPLKHLDEITTLTSRVCSQTLNNMFSS